MDVQSINVVIGRFQPLHKGHLLLLNRAITHSQVTLVIIGSSNEYRTAKNPLTYEERESLIRQFYVSHNDRLVIVPLPDNEDEDKWKEMFNNLLTWVAKSHNLPFTGSLAVMSPDREDDLKLRRSWINKDVLPGVTVDSVPTYSCLDSVPLSGTQVRRAWYQDNKSLLSSLVPVATYNLLSRIDMSFLAPKVEPVLKVLMDADKYANFVAFYTKATTGKPALLGFIMRHDGSLGFVGGGQEIGESVPDCIFRETKEEIGYDLTFHRFDAKTVCRHVVVNPASNNPRLGVTLLSMELDRDDMYEMQEVAVSHRSDEVAGFIVLPIESDDVWTQLANGNWAGSGKFELEYVKSLFK